MHFELEAIFAKKGDALIIHCGDPDADDPRWILIDGGVGVWSKFLKPRLNEIREDYGFEQLPIDMVMVSHVDDDHINGVLSLMRSVARDATPEYTIGTLWYNAFDRLLGTTSQEIVGLLEAEPADAGGAASVKQGVDLTQLATEAEAKGRLSRNKFFRGSDDFPALIVASEDNARAFPVGDSGVSFTVLAPNTRRLKAYQVEWDKELKKRKLVQEPGAAGGAASLKPLDPNDAFTFDDTSKYNLASIVVLAERDGRSMLLTGDATGNDIVEGLVLAGHLPSEGLLDAAGVKADRNNPTRPVPRFHIDLLKIPHHGSPNNVTTGFFRRVTADHYVFSGNGEYGNPSPHTLDMIREARGDGAYTFHFTMTEKEIRDHQQASNANDKREGLRRLHEWLLTLQTQDGPKPRLKFRQDGEPSISVPLS